MDEQNGRERLRHLRLDQCEAPRPHFGEQVKADTESQEPRNIGPPDETISIKSGGTTVQSGDGKVAEWFTGWCAMGKIQRQDRRNTEDKTSWWKTEEADHMANLASAGITNVTVDGFQRHGRVEGDARMLRRQQQQMETVEAVS